MQPFQIVCDNRLRIVAAHEVPSIAIAQLKNKFEHKNPAFGRAARFGRVPKGIPEEIVTWRKDGNELSIPRGGMSQLRAVFAQHELPYEVEDRRENGDALPVEWAVRRSLWPHQLRIVEVGFEQEQALVRAPTGCGKSIAALEFILRAGRWAVVVVPTAELARQWIESCASELGISEDEFGMIGDGKKRLAPITIALPLSLKRMSPAHLECFGTHVFDEVHRAAATSFLDVVDESHARFRLGVSADERRKDRKEFLIHDMFGKVALDIPRAELVKKGVVLDVAVRLVPTTFEAAWFKVLEQKKQAARAHIGEGKKLSPKTSYQLAREEMESFTRLLAEMQVDDARNIQAVMLTTAAARAGHRVLVFTHRREHAERLRAAVAETDPRVGLMLGGGKEDHTEFNETKRGLIAGTVVAGIGTYQALGTGIDIPAVDRGLCATPVHTNRGNFGQVRGRICRIGSKDAMLWYLWDELVFGDAPLRAMLAWNSDVQVFRDGAWVDGRADLAARAAAEGAA